MQLSTFKLFKNMKKENGWVTLNDKELKKLQRMLTEMADDIFSLCKENGIIVMLAYGSALGAVRHKGFIPWDDDMDIYIFRKDYKKFISLFEEKYNTKYWVHTPERTDNYGSLIAKVLKKDTILRKCEDIETDECGAFIDIFVLENEFNNWLLRNMHIFISYILAGIVSCRRSFRDAEYLLPILDENPEIKRILKRKAFIGKILSILSLNSWVNVANYWFQICGNDKSEYVFIPTVPNHKCIVNNKYKRSIFASGRNCDFDGRCWKIPLHAEKYLTIFYGDYMQLPAVEYREKHAYLEIKL